MDVVPLVGEEVPQDRSNFASAIDWESYSAQYDLLARNNPSYQENIAILRDLVPELGLPEEPKICDLGAGTGNFICALAKDLPLGSFVHVDSDPAMNRIAQDKYLHEQVSNVSILEENVLNVGFPEDSFDLILCVNALYAMGSQRVVLSSIKRWLKPSGVFFVIDFGRQSRLFDWGKYIFGNMYKKEGLGACLRFVKNGFETIKQNRKGSRGQASGSYWLHSTDEFAEVLSECGFDIDRLKICYRGYCDMAVCRVKQA